MTEVDWDRVYLREGTEVIPEWVMVAVEGGPRRNKKTEIYPGLYLGDERGAIIEVTGDLSPADEWRLAFAAAEYTQNHLKDKNARSLPGRLRTGISVLMSTLRTVVHDFPGISVRPAISHRMLASTKGRS